MIEPAVDDKGRLLWVSIVPPLTAGEHDALYAALKQWHNHPVVWTHNPPELKIIPLQCRFEPDIEDTP